MSDERQIAVCRQMLIGGAMERVRDRIPHQTTRQLVNSMRRACAGLRDMVSSQQEAPAAGRRADAETLAIQEVLIEELESWFE